MSVTRSSLPGGGPSSTALHLYDLRNKLIAATLPLQQVGNLLLWIFWFFDCRYHKTVGLSWGRWRLV